MPTTSFARDIRPMFRDADRACMLAVKFPDGSTLDLHDAASVQAWSARILIELCAGKMPMGGPEWDRDQLRLFATWMDEAFPA